MSEKQYELSPFPKDVIGIVSSSCVQKFQGDLTLKLQQMEQRTMFQNLQYEFMKKKSPAYMLTDQDRKDLEKFNGDVYSLCRQRGEMFLKKHFEDAILQFDQCLQVCDIEHASKYKGLLVIKRSMCRRKCEDAMDKELKIRMRDGKFPPMKELLEM